MKALGTFGSSREIVGLALGVLVLAAWPLLRSVLAEPAWLFFMISFLASVAGFVVGGTSSSTGLEPSAAVRRGVWAAAVTAVVAMSCFTLMARASMGPVASIRGLMGGVLSILPGMFYGMFCAGVAALVLARSPIGQQKQPSSPELLSPAAQWSVRIGVALLAVIAVASPFMPVTALLPQTSNSERHESPTSQPFDYAVPSDMVTAQAMQWQLTHHRTIGRTSGQLVTLSQDDRWLAYVPEQTLGIRVIDLHSPDQKGMMALPHPIDRLSFSPSADRILVTSAASPVKIGVLDLKTGGYVPLPKPKNRAMPSGTFRWWRDNEVLIMPSSHASLILNLDTLEIDDASAVPSWKETLLTVQQKIVSESNGGLSKTSRWQWDFKPMIESAELPEVEGSSGWPIHQKPCLAILHPDRDCRLNFPSISSETGDWFAAAQNGSKVLRVRQGMLEVFYFAIGPTPPLHWMVMMPHARQKCRRADDVHTALEMGRLRALVCAPMINPLNQAVVGPDRQRVKAVLSFSHWKEAQAELYVSQQFEPITRGDILADVSGWEGPGADLFEMETPHRWWTPLPDAAAQSDNIETVPSLDDIAKRTADAKAALDQARQAKLDEERKAREDSEKKAAAMREAMKPLAPRIVESAPPAPRIVESAPPASANATPTPEDRVREFVQAHYRKSLKGDVQHMVDDYADKVDYIKSGLVDRQFILRGELKFREDNIVLQETITGGIRLTKLGSSGYTATYSVIVRLQNARYKQNQTAGTYEVNLSVIESPTGLKITRQQVEEKP